MWQVESLRLTEFLLIPADIENIDWWEQVTNSNSETDNINRKTGERTQTGNFSNGILSLVVSPQRVDWKYSPILENTEFPTPRLGGVDEKFAEFSNLLSNWFVNSTGVRRVAFGAIQISDVENHEAGYNFLNSSLPNLELDPIASDFLFQINRPRNLNISDSEQLKINRLSRWHTLKGKTFSGDPADLNESKFIVARMELDINTDADNSNEFTNKTLKLLSTVLPEYASEIIEKGDIG